MSRILFFACLVAATTTAVAEEKGQQDSSRSRKGADSVISGKWIAGEKRNGNSDGEGLALTAICVEKPNWFVCLAPSSMMTMAVGRKIQIEADGGSKIDGEVLAIDPASPLILVKLEKVAKPVSLAERGTLSPGAGIFTDESREVVARFAGTDREYLGESLPFDMLRVHLNQDPADLVATPAFAANGALAGLFSNYRGDRDDVVHAIPASRISKLVSDYKLHQRTGKNRIGASFHRQTTTPEIVKIRPDSPAEKAGLQPGDVIFAVGDETVRTLPELASICESLPAGKPVKFAVLRRLQRIECDLVPELAPDDEKTAEADQ